MLASSTSKGTVLLSRIGRILGATTHSIMTTTSLNLRIHHEGVLHNSDMQRFEMAIEDNVAFIEYEKDANSNIYNLIETQVPDQFSGHGVGKQLAMRTFDHIISQNGKMILSCTFLQHFFEQNSVKYKAHILSA